MSLPFRLTDEQVAEMLGMKVSTLKRNVTRNPESLPPFLLKPKGHVFFAEVVLAFIEERMSRPVTLKIKFVSSTTNSVESSDLPQPPKMGTLASDLLKIHSVSRTGK